MKKIYLFIAAVLIAGASFAQEIGQLQPVLKRSMAVPSIPVASGIEATPTDTIGWPEFQSNTTGLALYGNIGGGYIFGTNVLQGNPGFSESAQAFIIADDFGIEEALIFFGAKEDVSGNPGDLTVKVYAMDGTGQGGNDVMNPMTVTAPGTELAAEALTFANADTNFGVFTAVPFADVVPVSSDFAIAVNVSELYTSGDTLGIISNQAGDAGGANLAFSYRSGLGWIETNWGYGNQLDVDIAIFAVADANYVGIDDDHFFYGMKLSQNAPNPVAAHTVIEYALEKTSDDVKLEIYDSRGRLVKEFDEGLKEAGLHKVKLETTNMASGTYYYSLLVDEQRLTKKMSIVK